MPLEILRKFRLPVSATASRVLFACIRSDLRLRHCAVDSAKIHFRPGHRAVMLRAFSIVGYNHSRKPPRSFVLERLDPAMIQQADRIGWPHVAVVILALALPF
jgi:hypothetical protein